MADDDFIMTLSDPEEEEAERSGVAQAAGALDGPAAGQAAASAAAASDSDEGEDEEEEFEMAGAFDPVAVAAAATSGKKRKRAAAANEFVFEVEDERAADPWDFREMRAVHRSTGPPGSSSIEDKIAKRLEDAAARGEDEDDSSSSEEEEEEEEESESDEDASGDEAAEEARREEEAAEAAKRAAEKEAEEKKKKKEEEAKKKKSKKDKKKKGADDASLTPETVEILKAGDVRVAKRMPETEDFGDLNLSRPLLRAIKDLNFEKPTAVQCQAVPLAMGGSDLLCSAMTGSGKTAAFMLPTLERLLYRPRRVALTRVLVLSPTRELAAQCQSMTEKLAKYSDIRVSLVVGGLSASVQETELRSRPDVVVATPGRLIDHLRNSRGVHLDDVEILILDEADRLLERGFADEVREIVSQCPRGRQTLLFSATLNREVAELANLSLNQPQFVAVSAVNSVVDTLHQEFVRVRRGQEESCEAIVLALCRRSFRDRTIVFVRSKKEAHRLMIVFGLAKLKAAELHGNLTQLQRLEALDHFRRGEVDYLICTDLAARGLDIVGVRTVINMSMPHTLQQYVHRVGRTARAGRAGLSVTLVTEDGRKLLKQIMAQASDVVTARSVPAKVVTKYRRRIEAMEGDIDTILGEERVEKEIRLAEMEANKTRNLVVHEDEIRARPQRTWFQTETEKQASKLAALHEHRGEDPEEKAREAAAERKRAEKEAKRAEKAKAKSKDPLRGLSRRKKRQKIAKMMAEREMKDRKRALQEGAHADQVGLTGEQRMLRQARAAKSKARRDGTDQATGATDDSAPGAVSVDYETGMAMLNAASDGKRGRKFRKKAAMGDMLDEEGGGAFSRRYAGSVDRQERKMREEERLQREKRKQAAGAHGKFKSKKRFKRRA